MEIKETYTTKEVADLLRVDVQTVRKYIRQNKIKAQRIGKRLIRVPYKEIEYLLDERR